MLPEMNTVRLLLSLAFFVPGFAFLGACAAYDNRERAPWLAVLTGALIGVFFGLVFGGLRGRWLDAMFPPADPDEAGTERQADPRKAAQE
jgi:RsiW-degrading membrane proteinase PrsW (M82 family)